MTVDQFRKVALSFPEAIELEHMGHPNFRVGDKIFATLGYPDENWAVVKLTPEGARVGVAKYRAQALHRKFVGRLCEAAT